MNLGNEQSVSGGTICDETKLVVSNNVVSDKINDFVVNYAFKDLGGA